MAVGLAALVWSCSSASDPGYDVALNLIPPTEVNGDDPLRAISVPVALSESNPSYNLAFVDTRGYAGLLRTAAAARRDGAESALAMSMEQFSFEADGTVDFFVRVFSRIGRISGRGQGYVSVSPASCSFTLDPNTATAEGYAAHIDACISDWINENGVPYEFDMEVSSAPANGSLPAASAKSGFGTKATASFYVFAGTWKMESNNPCDYGLDLEVLDAIVDGEDFFGLLDCNALALSGRGNTDSPIIISGGASIWDACGNPLNYAELGPQLMSPGEYFIRVAATENSVATVQNAFIAFFNDDPAAFTEDLLSAAAGRCVDGPDQDNPGLAIVDWVHCGPTPRAGNISVVAAGFCPLN